jgi:phage tail-like protein
MAISTAPQLRTPPHDPYTLLLGGRLGWPLAESSAEVDDGSIRLPRFADSLRLLTEPSGSMGGLRPPANVATTSGDDIWLLRTDPPTLFRFDPCVCGFAEVHCFGGAGSNPGQLDRPEGIAIAAGHLFVCDNGNRRVQVVLLPHGVVSGIWRAPIDWQPTDVAVDSRFRVHVVDPANSMVHHFGWSGRYLGNTTGVGASRFIAVGADGALYTAGAMEAYRIGGDHVAVPLVEPADGLASAFPTIPFEVAADGAMRLGPLCAPPSDTWFGLDGRPTTAPSPSIQLFERSATVIVGPLDSLIDECIWHRVVLTGELPAGSAITLDTTTAHVPLSAAEVRELPNSSWETQLTCTALERQQWDGLIRSPGGRYLWLRLQLNGNGATTPRIDEALVEFPRISLRRYLPAVFGAEPTSADFTDRLLGIFDRSLRDIESSIDDLPALLDPQSTDHLDWLASWIGLRPDRRLPEALQRNIISNAKHILDLRGTVTGLRTLLLTALGLDNLGCEPQHECGACPEPRQTCPPRPVVRPKYPVPPLILEHFRLRRWFEAGASTLGDRTVLWGESIVRRSQLDNTARVGSTALHSTQDPLRDPFHVHAHKFTVFVPAGTARTPEKRRAVEQLVAWGSPAHTVGHVEYVEPRMRIGIQASIGFDTVVARLPAGVTLGDTTLGPASVLTGSDRPAINNSTVGMTTLLG